MWDALTRIFAANFMPHGHCYFWEPGMVWLQVLSNLSIGLAYVAISMTLGYIVYRIRDLPFQWVYVAFGIFIVTCGFTHFMDVWVIWTPVYWLDGSIRAVTAVASVGTAVLLFPLVPKAVALAGAARLAHARGVRLEQLNVELEALYEKTRETLAEAIPQLVWTTSPDGHPDFYNRRWSEYSGEAFEAGSSWERIVHPDDLARATSRWAESLRSGEVYELEVRLRGADGGYRWFLTRGLPLRGKDDRVVRWFGTCTDIQEQKIAAEERERMLARAEDAVRARDVFLAIAAHELKTPLTPLRLETERLLSAAQAARVDRLTPQRLTERFSILQRQVGRLVELVAVLLDVTRIAGGKLELSLEEVDLGELVREVVERHRNDLERAGCEIALRVAPGAVGRWDRLRLDQVVTNLLTNAMKYGPGKPITVAVEVVDVGEARARLTVSDAGIGVAPEDHARIFERFERAASARHYGGMGLGLWIVRQVAEALGGSAGVASAKGEGAAFTVELPLRSAD